MPVAGCAGTPGLAARERAARTSGRPPAPWPAAATREASADGRARLQGVLQLLGVLVRERGPDHGAAVLLQRGDRLVRRRLLDHHEQRGRARLEVVAHLLLERLVDSLLAEVAEQRPHPGA